MNLVDSLYTDDIQAVAIGMGGNESEHVPVSPVVLAGSFNPLHRGHRRLLEVGEGMTGRVGWFEISIRNVDKPDLDRLELDRRLGQFKGYRGVILTRAPRFVEKCRLIPGAAFVIGFDTAIRLVDDGYYDGNPGPSDGPRWAGPLREIALLGGSFLVAGRADAQGGFREIGEISIPEEFQLMFRSIPEQMFREDVSSTELRNRGGGTS